MMYYKMIGDRQVFSDCKTIQTNEGVWISNPTEEQIAAAGWLPYVPPVIPPHPQTDPDMGEVMEAVKRMLANSTESLSDEDALNVAALFPTWVSKMGQAVNVGERYWYDSKLWKVIQQHTVQEDWTPDTAYNTGDKVSHNETHWVSTIDANTYEPGVYGWEAQP